MRYQAASSDDLAFDGDPARAYFHPLSSVMACYVYNGIITGRPYFLQMIEDTEIVTRFAHQQLQAKNIAIVPAKDTQLLAGEIVKTLPDLTMADTTSGNVKSWSQRVMDLEEQWPVQYVLPGGAYIR
jgi:hypothetical protein